ncbi:hypothetical protein HYE67_003976 [Fusarium culmorum]|uniref:BTB domain-containing protein n=1 Tax=Fusarium culmorum TaxID=5516 RepID=A0A7S8D4F7_FUSCU|nr:hypothetical protein HYE67_003976 [Fusarium culmorum]
MSLPTAEVVQKHARLPSSEDTDDESHIEEFCGTSIHSSLSNLLFSTKFADMTITCKEREFSAHRAIVCSQSSVFDKAMGSNFMARPRTLCIEATTQSIELQEDNPYIVERFLEFLYTGNYTDSVNPTWKKPSVAAMMDPTTVRQNLREPACGELDVPTPSNALFDDPDPEWQPPADEADEPEEEYREDEDEDDEDSSADGDEHSDQEDDANMITMEDVALAPKEEGLKLLARLRNDMTLPLRLYFMADMYDVPAMCEIVCRLVGARILDHEVREKMRPVMTKHGEFTVSVMEHAIRSITFAK